MMAEKISLKDLIKLKNKGVKLVDGKTGLPFNPDLEGDTNFIFELKSVVSPSAENQEKAYLKELQTLIKGITDLSISTMKMVSELQAVNKMIVDELKKPKQLDQPKIEVKPDVKPEIKLEPKVSIEPQPPKKWKHEVTNMTRTGRIIEIESTPID